MVRRVAMLGVGAMVMMARRQHRVRRHRRLGRVVGVATFVVRTVVGALATLVVGAMMVVGGVAALLPLLAVLSRRGRRRMALVA